ncbi:MurR/RpiR family transcriptional regulator [Gilliamella sp. wkB112]|uniref:MurR/RpiR family transcriptional regulator n=1 Tax=Gilliamella sp. wkB112 TaxID=3120257 RepID=UPI00080DF86C|nr:MurR/RpiR family transcriptional regulator [Gilliamella apicola]OCG02095.1 Fe-S cluster assembly protein HesB [Gilliamella apicola]
MKNNDPKKQLTELKDTILARYDKLSKRLKQVARYLLDNSNNVAIDTASSIAEKLNIPPSTLIRFANEFGFNGFNEIKQIFRQYYMENTANYTERARLLRSSSDDILENPNDILKISSIVNSQALNQLQSYVTNEQLDNAINLIKQAENIYVIGVRRSFSLAVYVVYALRHLGIKANLLDGLGGMYIEQLNMCTNKDTIITISYAPYASEVLDIINEGTKLGAKLLTITDSQVSPLVAFSDVNFIVREAQLNGFRSQIASMSLIQSLIITLALDSANNQKLHK